MQKQSRVDIFSFKAVIFDMDGVIVDSEGMHFKTMQDVFAKEGVNLEYDHFMDIVGHTTTRNIQDINKWFGRDFDPPEMVKKLHDAFAKELDDNGMDAQPGFFDLVEQLKSKDMPIALCTSSSREEAEYMFKFILKKHPEYITLYDIFDTSVTGQDIKNRKPHPDPYLKAMAGVEENPGDCLVFEDSSLGIASAKDAGCGMCIALRHPYNVNGIGRADFVIDSLVEVL